MTTPDAVLASPLPGTSVRALANPARRRAQVGWNVLWTGVSGLATLWIALIVLVLLSTIVLGGWRTITWEFLSQNPPRQPAKPGFSHT